MFLKSSRQPATTQKANIEEYDDNPAENTEELLPDEEADSVQEIPLPDECDKI